MNHNIVVVDIRIDGNRADVQSNVLITREHPNGPIIYAIGELERRARTMPRRQVALQAAVPATQRTIPAFQVRAMNTPVGEEKAMMAERWRQDLADAQAKTTANGDSR